MESEIASALLAYNFMVADQLDHGKELLDQLWYEFSINSCRLEPI